ncbi:MAG: aminoacyl-tRNA hydrolase [Candidatus Nanopelagicales bacterium]|nr:aminoacyl-tRNA hydrolase [Candidatus Nanopelagicales bacterium]
MIRLGGRSRESEGQHPPWVVIGLGNPGAEYADTRHNVGAMVVRSWALELGGPLKVRRMARCDARECRLGTERVILAVPRSYMNESGGAVAAVLSYYKAEADRLLVVHDELDLPFGSVRVKLGGGDNGHNGLRSVRRSLRTGEWYRLRVGIGRPDDRVDPVDYVLSSFAKSERQDLPEVLERARNCAETTIRLGLAAAQNQFNS